MGDEILEQVVSCKYLGYKIDQHLDLKTAKNNCIRCVYNLPKKTNVDKHHCWLKTLHVEKSVMLLTLTHMDMKSLDLPVPPPIPLDTSRSLTHSSGKILFTLPRPRSNKFLNSFAYKGAVAWNNLLLEEQMVPDLDQFKRAQKRKLLEIAALQYDT